MGGELFKDFMVGLVKEGFSLNTCASILSDKGSNERFSFGLG